MPARVRPRAHRPAWSCLPARPQVFFEPAVWNVHFQAVASIGAVLGWVRSQLCVRVAAGLHTS